MKLLLVSALALSLSAGTIAFRGSAVFRQSMTAQLSDCPIAYIYFGCSGNFILGAGDSITQSGYWSQANQYLNLAQAALVNPSALANAGVSGYTSANVITNQASSWAVFAGLVGNASFTRLTYSLDIGSNDLYIGTATPAQAYANIQTLCANAKTNGAANVIIWTITPRDAGGTPAGFETDRTTLNGLIRGGGACTYTVADIAANATMGPAGAEDNAAYYQDNVHPTVAGNVIFASVLNTALATLGIN